MKQTDIKSRLKEINSIYELYQGLRCFGQSCIYMLDGLISSVIRFLIHFERGERLVVGIYDPAGFGDTLMELPLAYRIKQIIGTGKCFIIFCNKYKSFYNAIPIVDRAEICKNHMSIIKLLAACDLVLDATPTNHMVRVRKADWAKISKISKQLFLYCKRNRELYSHVFNLPVQNYCIDQYGIFLNKHRLEFHDMHGILGVTKELQIPLPNFKGQVSVLEKFDIAASTYICINRDVGDGDEYHPKLWPIGHYQKLIELIHAKFPKLQIVLIGAKNIPPLKQSVDRDITGRTTLMEAAAILANSRLLISGEGGLVHLQHLLGGKSMVFFGPTDPKIYQYSENINLSLNSCSRLCYGLTSTWKAGCLKNPPMALCMNAITPEIAMSEIITSEILKDCY